MCNARIKVFGFAVTLAYCTCIIMVKLKINMYLKTFIFLPSLLPFRRSSV